MNYSTYYKNEYKSDLAYTKQFLFSFGSNYALATRLFNKRIREATIIFYAFVRYADELVDNPEKSIPGKTHTTVTDFTQEWRDLIVTKKFEKENLHPILRSTYWLFVKYEIPFDYSFDFLNVMISDINISKYETYADLERYMWGSASIVGHVMTYIIGYHNKAAFDAARSLGEAMQLTNFLRDIDEDMQGRNRIYIPQKDMRLFGVTASMIQKQDMADELYNLIQFYTQKTEQLFVKGEQGIKLLDRAGRFPVLLASRIYAYNLKILQQRNLNPFLYPKIRVSNLKKIVLMGKTYVVYLVRYRFISPKNI